MATFYSDNEPGLEVEVGADFNPENGLIEIWVDDPDDEFEYVANLRLTSRIEAAELARALIEALKESLR